MNISIIGSGYVGLVTGVCLAYKGHQVICVDKKKEVVNKINSAECPIYEPKLGEMLFDVISSKKLQATTDIEFAVNNTEVTIIAVGTPYNNDAIDLTYIKQSAREIGAVLKEKEGYHTVCVKSTVVPSTTDTVVRGILEEESQKQAGSFGLAMNPEFLREGCAVDDFLMPDRIVIGAYDDRSFRAIAAIYENIFDAPIIKTNPRSAEMIKYTSNSFLANLISFSNEISNICESIGDIDAIDVFDGLKLDKRIAIKDDACLSFPGIVQYLKPGCGFGGSCFPKDVKALLTYSIEHNYNPEMLAAIIKINELQPAKMINKLEEMLGSVKDKKIAVLGIAFKPETDDIRESPAIKLIRLLLAQGAVVYACDPEAVTNAARELGESSGLFLMKNHEEALRDAEAALIVTAWEEYTRIKPEYFRKLMKNAIIIDGRRVFDKNEMKKNGIVYTGIGLQEL